MKSPIQTIIDQHIPCYFISPHLDDAVLSVGGLLSYLSQFTPTTVINVFTRAEEDHLTLSARAFIKQCGYSNVQALYSARRQEDTVVFKTLNVTVKDLRLTDALFRRKNMKVGILQKIMQSVPELSAVYPTYRFHITTGKISKNDRPTIERLRKALLTIPQKAFVFCPVALGNHVDHIIVRDVCASLFTNAIFWSDFPYNRTQSTNKFLTDGSYTVLIFKRFKKKKLQLISEYRTQVDALFKGRIAIDDELVYIPKNQNIV